MADGACQGLLPAQATDWCENSKGPFLADLHLPSERPVEPIAVDSH